MCFVRVIHSSLLTLHKITCNQPFLSLCFVTITLCEELISLDLGYSNCLLVYLHLFLSTLQVSYCSELPKPLPSSRHSSHYLSKQGRISCWLRSMQSLQNYSPHVPLQNTFLALFLFKFYIPFKSSFKFLIFTVAFLVKYSHYVISNVRTLGTYFEIHSDCKIFMV